MVIYKYLLDINKHPYQPGKGYVIDLELPEVCVILSAVTQNGMPHVYAMVDPDFPERVKHRFYLLHTGDRGEDGKDAWFSPLVARFIGTCIISQRKDSGFDYVLHAFEGPADPDPEE